jgi:propionyl-CoA carboxylase alpha chain
MIAYAAVHSPEKDATVASAVQCLGATAQGQVLRYLGSEQEVIVRTLEEHKLSVHMLAPEVKDFSKLLLCPMPGTLISCSVVPGQKVEVGQQLAVVEAMKMQNVLRAVRAGYVKSVHKAAGDRLKVDEVIIEFDYSDPVAK